MKNKVLVKINLPELDQTFDAYLPVNELIWKIKKLLAKSISDLTYGAINVQNEYILINQLTGKEYNNNDILINTDIKNGCELILLSAK